MTASLVVERVGPGVTIQDAGRPGHMHEGVPPGGPLVPEICVASNRALGSDGGAAAIEIPLSRAAFRAIGQIVIAVDGVIHALADGEILRVDAGAEAVHYVALPGGCDLPVLLGGRGTLLAAGFGGHDGRVLRRGDVIAAAGSPSAAATSVAITPLDDAPIRVVLGPDSFPNACVDALLGEGLVLSATMNRVGHRLDGVRFPVTGLDRQGSQGVVRGAIQVTTDGTPIVLGPDHPTTGGYPVIAVVVSSDWGRLARRRPGAHVRFVLAR